MRAVVVTLLPQPDLARDRHGVYRRLGMFLHGIKEVCDEIEIVHFATRHEMTQAARASAISSAFWGIPVSVSIAPLNEQPRHWWQAGLVPFTLRYRRDFRPYLGRDQAAALEHIIGAAPAMIFAHRLPAMEALLRLPVRSPIFFDLDDVEHRVKWRAARTATSRVSRMRNSLEIPALLAAEQQGVVCAVRTFVCSAFDRSILSDLGFDVSRTVVVPNAAEIPAVRPALSPSRSILFLGNYGHYPNAEAAERLITGVWPRLTTHANPATLIIAGDHPERILSYRNPPPNVEFTGFVTNLEALYARVRIVCCPLRNGGGTRLKLIEAAGYGKPIVATPMAAEGLEFGHRRDVLIHETDDELALACAQLLQDDAMADALAAAAHRKARALYSLARQPGQIARELTAGLASHAAAQCALDAGRSVRFHQFRRLVQSPTAPGARRESR